MCMNVSSSHPFSPPIFLSLSLSLSLLLPPFPPHPLSFPLCLSLSLLLPLSLLPLSPSLSSPLSLIFLLSPSLSSSPSLLLPLSPLPPLPLSPPPPLSPLLPLSLSLPLQYLGHVEVEESRGMHICEEAVKRLKTVRSPCAPRHLLLLSFLTLHLLLLSFLLLPPLLVSRESHSPLSLLSFSTYSSASSPRLSLSPSLPDFGLHPGGHLGPSRPSWAGSVSSPLFLGGHGGSTTATPEAGDDDDDGGVAFTTPGPKYTLSISLSLTLSG